MPYPGQSIPSNPRRLNPPIVTIPNIRQAFDGIPTSAKKINIHKNDDLTISMSYDKFDIVDVSVFRNNPNRKRHFQGIVRTRDGKHLIISGGDHKSSPNASQLFICKIGSHTSSAAGRPAKEAIGTNLDYDPVNHLPPLIDVLEVLSIVDSSGFWHAGGMSLYHDILIVPLESSEQESIIKFIDVSTPTNPRDLGIEISRPNSKAGAASLIRLPNKHYLCMVWVDSDKEEVIINGETETRKPAKMDFYLSKSTDLSKGFLTGENEVKQLRYGAMGKSGRHPKYQMIQLLLQDNNQIYFIGAENSYSLAPIPPWVGKNRMRLYKLRFPGDISDPTFTLRIPSISMIREDKRFDGGGKQYNFKAGSGIYITPDKKLAAYACHHRMNRDGFIPVGEFMR